jgi:hypothetical protein
MDPRNAERQKALGLPAEPLLDRRLLFDPASRSLVLVFNVTRGGIAFPQVYVRGPEAPSYLSVTGLFSAEQNLGGDSIAVETPVLAGGGRLYCLFNSRGQRSTAGHVPIFSVGIGLVDLATQRTTMWPTPSEFSATELIGSASDGSRVYAVVGVLTSAPDGKRVNYGLGELDISAQTMQVVASLPTPFF